MSGVPNKFTDVKPKYTIPQKPHPTANVLMYYLEGEIKEKFFELYPTHTNPELMKIFGVCYGIHYSLCTYLLFAKRHGCD